MRPYVSHCLSYVSHESVETHDSRIGTMACVIGSYWDDSFSHVTHLTHVLGKVF
jgi:hypothetical protein